MTVIQSVATTPGGVPLGGATVTVALVTGSTGPGFTGVGTIVGATYVTTSDVGAWSIDLTPNSTVTPSGTYYRITEQGGAVYQVIAPASGGPYHPLDVLVVAPVSPDPLGVRTTRQINAGAGLSGGGDLSADRTLAVVYGTTAGTAAQGNDGRLSDARTPTAHAASHAAAGGDPVTPAAIGAVPTSRTVTAGTGLTGGGDLSANRTLAVTFGTTAGTTAQGNDSRITGAIPASLVDVKGDLLVGTGDNAVTRLPVGSDGHQPYADPAASAGIAWRPPDPDAYIAGVTTMRRRDAISSTVSGPSTGTTRLTWFTAGRGETWTRVAVATGGTAAGATPTLCRLGIYLDDGSGNLTLVASCANDTSLFAAANTRYERNLTAPYVAVAGARYALGVIIVSAAASPTFVGSTALSGVASILLTLPRLQAVVASPTDLQASISSGAFANSGNAIFGELLP